MNSNSFEIFINFETRFVKISIWLKFILNFYKFYSTLSQFCNTVIKNKTSKKTVRTSAWKIFPIDFKISTWARSQGKNENNIPIINSTSSPPRIERQRRHALKAYALQQTFAIDYLNFLVIVTNFSHYFEQHPPQL